MVRPGQRDVPSGPLAVRWHGVDLGEVRAGAVPEAHVELENAGSAAWRAGVDGVKLAYHWLDELGNPIVWDGIRTPLAHAIAPGDRARVAMRVRGAIPPGRYRLALDLVDEHRFWLS